MSFSSQRAVRYLVDQFQYSLLIRCIKTAAVLKRQRFKDSESEERKPRVSKCQRLGVHDDEEGQSLDKYEGEDEGEDVGYVLLSFVAPPPPPQKESNRLTDMGKGTRSLNHLVCIPKIGLSYNCKFCVRVPRQRVFKSKKTKPY